MMTELAPLYASVRALAPSEATPAQIAACTSFSYNEGLAAFRGSTLCRLWFLGNIPGAAAQFSDWIFIHDPITHQLVRDEGLVNRRAAEKAVFLGQNVGAQDAGT